MAESKNNVIVHGFSGKFGDLLVFRQKAGKTIAAQASAGSTKEPSAAQQEIRSRFQRAAIYGKSVMADPALKSQYQEAAEPGQTAYNVCIADFFNAPDIVEIDVSAYTGQTGQPIKVKVVDDFKVKQVRIAIHNSDGSLQEEGDAVQASNGPDWTYTTITSNPSVTGDKITVTATDTPDNLSTDEQML